MVLIGLLQKHFFGNLKTQKFPSHVIIVRKEDLLNVKQITCLYLKGVNLSASKSINLSNLEKLSKFIIYLCNKSCLLIIFISIKDMYGINPEEIKIEGFSSLNFLSFMFHTLNQVILTNLIELRKVMLYLETPINSKVLLKLIEYLPYIEKLHLHGKLSYFNLDSMFNLKELCLSHTLMNDFNFHLFDNLCNQLEYINISCRNFDENCVEKLFYGRNFPYLSTLYIVNSSALSSSGSCIEFIDKTMFSNLINLKKLILYVNQIESIEENSFSSLHNVEHLDLSCNRLTSLSAKSFVGLDNLKYLNLAGNKLVNFEMDIFDNIDKIEEINLYKNPIMNKDEILSRSLKSNIKVYI